MKVNAIKPLADLLWSDSDDVHVTLNAFAVRSIYLMPIMSPCVASAYVCCFVCIGGGECSAAAREPWLLLSLRTGATQTGLRTAHRRADETREYAANPSVFAAIHNRVCVCVCVCMCAYVCLDEEIKMRAIVAVGNLAEHVDCRIEIRKTGGLLTLINLLSHANPLIIEKAVWSVGRVSAGEERYVSGGL